MEMPITDRDILNNEIAKLRQADMDFGEPSPCIGILTYFPSSPEEFKIDTRETPCNDVNATELVLLSPCKLDPNLIKENEVPVDPLALSLALNRKLKQKVASCLKNIQIALDQNRNQQEYLRSTFNDVDLGAVIAYKRRNMSLFGKPYFKDIEGSFPKPNSDTIKKNSTQEIDAFTRPSKPWTIENKNDLMKSVKADFLQRRLRPLMNREQIELAKLKNAVEDSEEMKKSEEILKHIRLAKHQISNSGDLLYGTLEEVNDIDWMKIANSDLKEQRSIENCKSFWKNVVHPSINKSKWTKKEDDRLIELAEEFKGRRWEDIAKLLGTGRSAFMCLKRYQTKFNPLLQAKWSLHEDKFLEKTVSHVTKRDGGINWSRVAKIIKTKSASECEYRWNRIKTRILNRSKWNSDLDKKLYEAVKVFGSNWMKVAKYVPGKTSGQCSDRYKNKLKDTLKFGYWTPEEDKILWLAVKQHGLDGKWSKISSEFLPRRTDNQILLRYRRLQTYEEIDKKLKARKKNSENNENDQNAEVAVEDSTTSIMVPKRRKFHEPKPKARSRHDLDADSPYFGRGVSPTSEHKDYTLRKRKYERAINAGDDYKESDSSSDQDDVDDDDDDDDDDEEISAKRPRLEELDNNGNTTDSSRQPATKGRPSKTCILNDEIINLLADKIKTREAMDNYKLKQRSKPAFREDVEGKIVSLLGNALKLPISNGDLLNPSNVPLLPPNRSSILAFAKLMENRKDLVKAAGLFQFPNCIKLPEPWDRTQVEKFVETTRTFGDLVPKGGTFNSSQSQRETLLFNHDQATKEDIEVISNLGNIMQKSHNTDQIISKHNQASRVCRQVRSSEDYLKLQLKFTSLFFWPLLLNYSSED